MFEQPTNDAIVDKPELKIIVKHVQQKVRIVTTGLVVVAEGLTPTFAGNLFERRGIQITHQPLSGCSALKYFWVVVLPWKTISNTKEIAS